MVKRYLHEEYKNATNSIKLCDDVESILKDLLDDVEWCKNECQDINDGELNEYSEETLIRYSGKIYRLCNDLYKFVSDFRNKLMNLDIDDYVK